MGGPAETNKLRYLKLLCPCDFVKFRHGFKFFKESQRMREGGGDRGWCKKGTLHIGFGISDRKATSHDRFDLSVSAEGATCQTEVVFGRAQTVGNLRDASEWFSDWAEFYQCF